MKQLNIRTAQKKDAKELSELICENATAMLKPHYSHQQWNVFIRYYSEKEMAEKIVRQTAFCAELNNRIVGTIALDGHFVAGFYTRLRYLGQGIGKVLMIHLENFAKDAGLNEIQLAASPEGLAFYLKNGWEKVNDIAIDHFDVGFEETLMKKELTKSLKFEINKLTPTAQYDDR